MIMSGILACCLLAFGLVLLNLLGVSIGAVTRHFLHYDLHC